jgi:hypothetical protein
MKTKHIINKIGKDTPFYNEDIERKFFHRELEEFNAKTLVNYAKLDINKLIIKMKDKRILKSFRRLHYLDEKIIDIVIAFIRTNEPIFKEFLCDYLTNFKTSKNQPESDNYKLVDFLLEEPAFDYFFEENMFRNNKIMLNLTKENYLKLIKKDKKSFKNSNKFNLLFIEYLKNNQLLSYTFLDNNHIEEFISNELIFYYKYTSNPFFNYISKLKRKNQRN